MFTRDLLQAINDWQIGGNAKQKSERGKKLREEASKLPDKFHLTDAVCYRRLKLLKSKVWTLGTDEELSETISAWSETEDVAKCLKGGVPEPGFLGVIFRINPNTGKVIVNLSRLYKDEEFQKAIEEHKGKINEFASGIGKYGNSQEEVVIENGSVHLAAIYGWGGFTSSEEKLAEQLYRRKPNEEEMVEFRKLMEVSGHKAGQYWMTTPDAVERLSAKLVGHAERLANLKT